MLLRSSFIFLFILAFIASSANDSTLTWKQWRKSWGKREIYTKRIDLKREGNLIKLIEVLDVRSDTERVGIYTNEFHNPCEIVYDTPIDFLIKKTLCNDTAKETVLLVIRNFWINEVQYLEGKLKHQRLADAALPSTKLTCSIDAFIKHEGKYIPLIQVDTIFTDKRNVFNSSRNLTEKALFLIQNKLQEGILANKYWTKKQTDKEFIEKVYNRRFKIAAITDSTFRKGIFYTWEQFKNNKPIEKEFSIKSNKNEPHSLFIKDEKGNEILTRDVLQ